MRRNTEREQANLISELDTCLQTQDKPKEMVKFRRVDESKGRLVWILGGCLLLMGIMTLAQYQRNQPNRPSIRSPEIVSEVSTTNESEKGSRTFEFELSTLKGLEGTKGTVVIQTMPEWAPLGVEHFHVSNQIKTSLLYHL